ncbi:putative PurR-regulated permease PerM [Cryobacterium sp. MP_3.1]|uniref:AI-2E family transporter n=1 Tax=Cryobacterium sp. MP_3.1 TaxID=3071711 RepID=UPI002E05D567|nr:putative PurR-regulated permease PerM [Cryobacterium sp. MP_3.1]
MTTLQRKDRLRERLGTGANAFANHPFRWAFVATLGVLAALVIAAAVAGIGTVVFSVFAAAFITLGLDPLVRWFERRGMKRGGAILTVNLLFVLVIVGMLSLVLPLVIGQAVAFVNGLPAMLADLRAEDWFQQASSGSGGLLTNIYSGVVDFLTNPATWTGIGGGLLQVGVAVISAISTATFIFILTIYFTATLDSSKAAIYTLVSASHRERVVGLAERIMQNIGRYLSGMVVLAFLNATFSLILLTLVGNPFALVISVSAFFITLIPLIGTVLTTAFMTILTLFVSPTAALVVLIAMLIYMQIEAYILTPRVMSKAVNVPGSIVLIAALAGGTLAGLPGALVAIPVAAGILLILKEVVIPAKALS